MNYIGITTGPIFKTIKEAVSPAGLWYASRFFSELTRQLCLEIQKQFEEAVIFSPYFDDSKTADDGIGKYHDRILFSCPEIEDSELSQLIEKVKADMAGYIPEELGNSAIFLSHYLQVSFCILSEEDLKNENGEVQNLVFSLNKVLDALELMAVTREQVGHNVFETLFLGEKERRNEYVRQSKLYHDIEKTENFLWNKTAQHFRSITDIAHGTEEDGLSYFAVVNSDGDKVGSLLRKICLDEKTQQVLPLEKQVTKITKFSKSCLEYAEKAAKEVNKVGGMTIYAGGDDLLFLCPITPLIPLCKKLNDLFVESFSHSFDKEMLEELNVSLSFGASIHYEKYPLYEALEEAANLMYDAKKQGGSITEIGLTKHSGQSVKCVIKNNKLSSLMTLTEQHQLSPMTLQSLGYKVGQLESVFRELFEQAKKQKWDLEKFVVIFKSNFDNVTQEAFLPYIEEVSKIYYKEFLFSEEIDDHIAYLQSLIRLVQFWNKGDNQ